MVKIKMGDTAMTLVRQEIIDLADNGPVDLETYKNLRMNSYEQFYLLEFLSDEAFVHHCANCLKQVFITTFPVTYEQVILVKLFPELLTRFEKLRDEFDTYIEGRK